jgi:hypothetical protein
MKHKLSILHTLFPSFSNLYLAVSVPMSVMSLVYIVHAFISFCPQANDVGKTHRLIVAAVP